MLTRRGFASCALCGLSGFVATGVEAQTTPPPGIQRAIRSRMDGPTAEFETIVAEALIEQGFQVPRHIHPGIESAYIVEGGGLFSMDGAEARVVKAGDVVQVPSRRPHALKCGDKPTRILSTYVLEKGQPISIPS